MKTKVGLQLWKWDFWGGSREFHEETKLEKKHSEKTRNYTNRINYTTETTTLAETRYEDGGI